MKTLVTLLLLVSAYAILSAPIGGSAKKPEACEVKAFPQAFGFGTNTPGGRGGQIIYVTNLDELLGLAACAAL